MANLERPFLSVIVPVFNESENIEIFYQRLKNVLNNLNESYEVIFVNDGSTDDTLNKLVSIRNVDSNVKIIDFSRNFGKEAALTAGLDFSSGEVVVPIDADLQDPPELIPELINKWREGYDVVLATRKKREGEGWLKRVTAYLFYRLANKVMPIDLPKDTGDFRLISRQVVETLKEIRERNRFMKGIFAWTGFSTTTIYYYREKRHKGKTKWNYWKLWNFALEGITSFSYIPLQLASLMGVFVALCAFIYAVFIVAKTLLFGRDVPGYASLMTVILFIGGIQLICIGILGEYTGRIYNEVKQRPLYVVRRTWGIGN